MVIGSVIARLHRVKVYSDSNAMKQNIKQTKTNKNKQAKGICLIG